MRICAMQWLWHAIFSCWQWPYAIAEIMFKTTKLGHGGSLAFDKILETLEVFPSKSSLASTTLTAELLNVVLPNDKDYSFRLNT
jgi:hypothetical protein